MRINEDNSFHSFVHSFHRLSFLRSDDSYVDSRDSEDNPTQFVRRSASAPCRQRCLAATHCRRHQPAEALSGRLLLALPVGRQVPLTANFHSEA